MRASRFLGNDQFEIFGGDTKRIAKKACYLAEKFSCKVTHLESIDKKSDRRYAVIAGPTGVNHTYLVDKSLQELPIIIEKPVLNQYIIETNTLEDVKNALIRRKKPTVINYQYIHFAKYLRRYIRKCGNEIKIALLTNGKYRYADVAFDLIGHAVSIISELGIGICIDEFEINIEPTETRIWSKQSGNSIEIKVAQVSEKNRKFWIKVNGVEYKRTFMNTKPIQYTLRNDARGHSIQVIDPIILQHKKLLYSSITKIRSRLYEAIKMEEGIKCLINRVVEK